jgi:AcrR family transcriptional regulator
MPRITAPTIAEHVSRKEEDILAAAAVLFAEQGLVDTSMEQIADRAGLARSSVYRYFPDKAHILVAWFERQLPEVAAAAERAAMGGSTPMDRLERWLAFQIDYTCDPAHELGNRLHREVAALSPELQAVIAEGHHRLWGFLQALVAETLSEADDPRDPALTARLVEGLLRSATAWVAESGNGETATRELVDAVRRLLA